MYLVGIAAAIIVARRRWAAAGGDPELVYDVATWSVPAGIIGGRIYFGVTTPMDIPHVWYGIFAVWDGDSGSGARSPSRHRWGRGGSASTAAAWRHSWMRSRLPCWSPRGSGGSGTTSTRNCSAAPRTCLGAGDPARLPAAWLHGLRNIPAVLPVRADLGLRAGGFPCLARASPEDRPAGFVRPVCDGLYGVPHLRGVDPDRLLKVLPAANRDGSPYDEFAAIQQFYFDRDMTALGVGRSAMEPRAHAYIGQVTALAAGLLDRARRMSGMAGLLSRGRGGPGGGPGPGGGAAAVRRVRGPAG